MIAHIRPFFTDESGATAIEYGLIAALVSIAAVGTLPTIGASINTMFGRVETVLGGVAAGGAAGTGG